MKSPKTTFTGEKSNLTGKKRHDKNQQSHHKYDTSQNLIFKLDQKDEQLRLLEAENKKFQETVEDMKATSLDRVEGLEAKIQELTKEVTEMQKKQAESQIAADDQKAVKEKLNEEIRLLKLRSQSSENGTSITLEQTKELHM